MKEIQAPDHFMYDILENFSIFLAGSIEMGKAIDWQKYVTEKLSDQNILILNPRRRDWDSSWEQKKENEKFFEQVTWELKAQEKCDVIVINFCENTMSPITLLELGLAAASRASKLIVHCPDGFWRKGNVDIVCARYDVKMVNSLDELISEVKIRFEQSTTNNF